VAKKVSLINMKGGVGKSTLTVNLAWHFSLRPNSKRVLVIDLDPQFNASQYLLGQTAYARILRDGRPTIWDVFEQHTRTPQAQGGALDIRNAVHNRITLREGGRIDLIPSRLDLAYSLKTPFQQKETELAKAIRGVEDDYDLILIDCAPTESILTTAAYLSSDFLLVPVKPGYLSTIGLPLLVNSMRDVREAYPNNTLELAGVIFNATTEYAPEEMLAKADVRQIAQTNQWYVFESEVTYSRSYPKSARLGVSIYGTPNARSKQMRRFRAFAQEFARRIGL
jgi:chromosome partitioning protein